MLRIACVCALLSLLVCPLGIFAADRLIVSATEQARIRDASVQALAAQLVSATVADSAGQTVLTRLQALQNDPGIDPVRRDAIYLAYVNALREGNVAAIPAEVLEWLSRREPGAYVGHEESATATVPLFDVASAAHGLVNQQRYDQVRNNWKSAQAADLSALVDAYIATDDPTWRAGAEAAAAALSSTQRLDLIDLLNARAVDEVEELLIVSYRAGGNHAELSRLLPLVSPAVARRILDRNEAIDAPEHEMDLCRAALGHRDAGVRGLAIACGTRASANDPTLREAWIDELGHLLTDAEHGSAAALQLARLADDEVIDALIGKRSHGADPLLGRRLELVRRLREMTSGESAVLP
jgi:hypothetical protein